MREAGSVKHPSIQQQGIISPRLAECIVAVLELIARQEVQGRPWKRNLVKPAITRMVMDIDFSCATYVFMPSMPADSSFEPPGNDGTLGSHTVTLSPGDHQYLRVKGFREQDIHLAVDSLRDSREITLDNVMSELDYDSGQQRNQIKKALKIIRKKNRNVATAAQFSSWLWEVARACKSSSIKELERHYAALWPKPWQIADLVDQWPESYHADASTIKRRWPLLPVNRDIHVDCSANFDVCTNQNAINVDSAQVSYPAFFKLIKDIWYTAIRQNNRGYLNRVAHLLVSFAHVMSREIWVGDKDAREHYHAFAIARQMKGGLEATEDIAALCFWASMHPPSWRKHQKRLYAELFRRALRERVTCLVPYYHQWLAINRTGPVSDATEVAKQIEQVVIPETVMLSHFLEAIASYIRMYQDQDSTRATMPLSDFFDSVTGQLDHPVWAPCWESTAPRQAVIENLDNIYHASELQPLFRTPTNRHLPNKAKKPVVTDEQGASHSREKKQQAIRTIIDRAAGKAAAQKAIRQQFAHLTLVALEHVYRQEDEARNAVKLLFFRTGLEAKIDPDDHTVAYGELHYQLRKEAFRQLQQYKKYVESVLGTTIPIAVSRSQINAIVERFYQLPIEERRYWKMSRSYAESTLLPELVQDLLLGKMAQDSKDLQARQKLFITCKCLTCSICNVDTYYCKCRANVGYSLTRKFGRYAETGLLTRIKKDVRRYLEPRCCQAPFNIRLAIVDEPAEADRRDQASLLRPLKKKGCNAHRTSDGQLCRKRHSLKPESLGRSIAREVWFRRTREPEYLDRVRLGVEPAGARAARHFYRAVGLPKYAIDQPDGARKWFVQHPERKEEALQRLENYPGLKPLINRETLAFQPKSFHKIKCHVVYHDLDDFQQHLARLRPATRYPKLPLTRDARGLYLHKTFCLCCRINFGHHKELKQHLQTHHDNMLAVFKEIDQLPPQPPAASPMDNPEQFLQDASNKELAASQLRLYQRDTDRQMAKRFWYLQVRPDPTPVSNSQSTTDSDSSDLD